MLSDVNFCVEFGAGDDAMNIMKDFKVWINLQRQERRFDPLTDVELDILIDRVIMTGESVEVVPSVKVNDKVLTGNKDTDSYVEGLRMPNRINHPPHYGGADNIYETIKVIDSWGLNFELGNAVKYIPRAGKKDSAVEDLKKAIFYLQHEVERLEHGNSYV